MSKRELILQDLVTTLRNIKKDNGYNYTVKTVTRTQEGWDKFPTTALPALVITDDREEITYIAQRVHNRLFVTIRGILDHSETASQDMNKLIEDVKLALGKDVTRGGYASDTQITTILTFQRPEMPRSTIFFQLLITYEELNPYR